MFGKMGLSKNTLYATKRKMGFHNQNHFMMYVDCFDAINLCSFGCCVTNREKANFFLRVFLETPKCMQSFIDNERETHPIFQNR
jgi:hypothetical protein